MIEYEAPPTHYLGLAVEQAVNMANRHGEPVRFEFNGIVSVVHPGGAAQEVERIYFEAFNLRAQVAQLKQLLETFKEIDKIIEWHNQKTKELAAALERCKNP